MRWIGDTQRTEEELLEYIDEYWRVHWTSPSYEQLGEFLGLRSKASVSYHLHRLVDRGVLVKRDPVGKQKKALFRRAA